MKFQKNLMAGYRDMGKNIKNAPEMGFFPNLWPSKIFFKTLILSFLSLCKIPGKHNEQSLRCLKTNFQTYGQVPLLWTPTGKVGVHYWLSCISRRIKLIIPTCKHLIPIYKKLRECDSKPCANKATQCWPRPGTEIIMKYRRMILNINWNGLAKFVYIYQNEDDMYKVL